MGNPRLDPSLASEAFIAWQACGCIDSAAARQLGLPRATFKDRLDSYLRDNGLTKALAAQAPEPIGYEARKRTVQLDAAGNVVREWRHLHREAETLQLVADQLCKAAEGRAAPLPGCKGLKCDDRDLLLEVPLYDLHIGKYCWSPETGQDYDSDKARDLALGSVAAVAQQAGPVGEAVLVIGGDFFHADSRHNTTERGGNVLDVDTRQAKVWETATDTLVRSVQMLGRVAKTVSIVVIPGNHDWESSFHLQRLLAAYYRKCPRVRVHESPRSRTYLQHGKVLLGFAHGHLLKPQDLASLMAQEMPKAWSETTERVWHLGHFHKAKGMRYLSGESQHGVVIEYLESLCATDAWHHEQGYVGSPRRMESFLWHREEGLIGRIYHKPKEGVKP